MKKAIATISIDPLIQKQCEVIQSEKERLEERFQFLRKQASDAGSKMAENCKRPWSIIEDRLLELGVLPKDFQKGEGKYSLQFDPNANVIYLDDGELDPNLISISKMFEH